MSQVIRLILFALLVVALAVLLSLGAAVAQSSGDQAIARLLPDQLPVDVPNGVVDTPLGKARWAHLTGDPTTLPDPLQPNVAPTGLIWFESGGRRYESCQDPDGDRRCETDVPPKLWTSNDAVSARVEHQLPVDAASAGLFLDGDTYWLTTARPDTLWRSMDLVTWEPLDVSGLESPGPSDLGWDVEIGIPVTSRGTGIVPLTYRVRDPGRLVGDPGFSVRLEAAGPGRYLVTEPHFMSQGGDVDIGSVLVKETPTGIRITDDDGATLSEIRGVGLDFVEAWAARGSIEEHQLGIIEAGTVIPVDMPGEPPVDPSDDVPALFPVDDGFRAFQVDADLTVRMWRSEDGRSWTEGDRVRGPDGHLLEAQWVSADSLWGEHDATILTPDDPDGDGRVDQWRSSDGESWILGDPWPPSTGEEGLVFPAPNGSLRLADDGSWAASRDGTTWVDVPELREVVTKWMPEGAGGNAGSLIGDALFFSVYEDGGSRQRDLWIIEFDQSAP